LRELSSFTMRFKRENMLLQHSLGSILNSSYLALSK
jgi:hypothetical protein